MGFQDSGVELFRGLRRIGRKTRSEMREVAGRRVVRRLVELGGLACQKKCPRGGISSVPRTPAHHSPVKSSCVHDVSKRRSEVRVATVTRRGNRHRSLFARTPPGHHLRTRVGISECFPGGSSDGHSASPMSPGFWASATDASTPALSSSPLPTPGKRENVGRRTNKKNPPASRTKPAGLYTIGS